MRRVAALALVACALAVSAGAARASMEQFGSFDVFATERDDENALDYYLSRPVDEWNDEWERATSALRLDQGCLASNVWYQSNEFKARSPLGQHSWLDAGFLQRDDPEGAWQWLQLDFMWATRRFGAWGGRFRPANDKSRQDFALLWAAGDGRSPLELRATLTIEDTFNKLWTFRQTQVGDDHFEPYRVHPFEPALEFHARGPRHRLDVSGTWLTASRRDIVDPRPSRAGTATLWGSESFLRAERTRGAWTAGLRLANRQATSSLRTLDLPGDRHSFRRHWSAEGSLRRTLPGGVRAEAHYLYTARTQDWHPPAGDGRFEAIDRMATLEMSWQARPRFQVRTGLLYDRIGVALRGTVPGGTFGSRKESRAYVGLQARWGNVRVQAVEGIELDVEPYEVSFHHDKGFLHLQTTF